MNFVLTLHKCKTILQFLTEILSVPHKCGKARALLYLNVLVDCKIDGFCAQSLKPVVPLLFLCCVLLEKYISKNEFLDN